MSYSYPEIKNFAGLFLQQNSFSVPDGAMEVAQNIIVSKDQIITKRRGNYTYFDPSAGTLNRLFQYQNKLLAAYETKFVHYADTGVSPNETGTETQNTGQTVAITTPRVSRSLQSNNNFYFTTDNGVLKLTAYDSIISQTGAPQGLDISGMLVNGVASEWFGGGNIVGYRVVFGYTDANDNLILGAPSGIATLTNPKVEDKAWARSGGGPYTVTVTSNDHGLVTGQYLTFSGGAGGTPGNYEGVYQITVLTANTFSYSVTNDPGASGTVDYAYGMPVRLEFTVPTEVTTAQTWFYQIYRSSQQLISTGLFSDFKLVVQENLTSAQYSSRIVFFTDDYDDLLLGAELYTNENSREGELQANFRPPLCDDVTLYKNFAIYGKCTTRHLLDFALVDTTNLANADYVEIKVGVVTRRYVAQTGIGNQTTYATCQTAAGDLQINVTAHGLSNGNTVYIANVVGGTLTAGTYFVVSAAADTFEISLTNGGASIAYNGETSLDVEGVTNGTYPIFILSESASAAVRLRDTAQGLMKAVNRDNSSLVYGQYVSGINDVPGKMRLQAKGFTAAIYLRANTVTAGTAFNPPLPDSFGSGTQVYSRNDQLPHVFFASKQNEPEAVPLVNFFTVGAKNKAIIRILALRDSMIVLKEDGVYRVTGDALNNLVVTLLDSTVQILATSSADVLNNQVVFLSNQGVCLVTESSVQIISRKIEDVIQPILGQPNLSTQTGGVAYESERLYLLTTTDPNNTSATHVYAYNILTDSWARWDNLFKQGVIGPMDTLFTISTANDIQKERKKQTRIDYCGQNYAVTVVSVSSGGLTAVITSPNYAPQLGDVVIKNNVINRLETDGVLVSGSNYAVTFRQASNLTAADSLQIYAHYDAEILMSPFHAGLVGRDKLFSQMQIHLRDSNCSRLFMTFSGPTYSSSEEVTWVSQLASAGWGQFPWGFEPWGQQDAIDITAGTKPAPIVRIYVPRFQARNTFIQPRMIHMEAAESLNFQAMSFAVRAYRERVTR